MNSPRAILRLIYAPRSLATAATAINPVAAYFLGACALALAWAGPAHAVGAGISEPYLTFAAYVNQLGPASSFIIPMLVLTCFALVVALPIGMGAIRSTNPPERTAFCAVLLSPIPFIIPLWLWSPLLFLAATPQCVFPAAVPPWTRSTVIQIAGAGWWALVAIVLWLFLVANAFRRLRRMAFPNICRACAYDLTGLPSPTCPECGTSTPTDK